MDLTQTRKLVISPLRKASRLSVPLVIASIALAVSLCTSWPAWVTFRRIFCPPRAWYGCASCKR